MRRPDMCMPALGVIQSVEGSGVGAAAQVRVGARLIRASLALVPEARPGDRVMLHTGIVVALVDDEPASSEE
ncbi:MAG TPA: HypC/HybG/HupF family hydrogenase formation chaperone [Acidimicrobiia bacterium]|nr:HypC/HybG/HupF family hydrogenase formation chaperone [Acidimicrobiia bacterium]